MSQFLSHLECGNCGAEHDHRVLQTVCAECGGPLLARYRLDDPALPQLDQVLRRSPGQFRFHELLPTEAGAATPTLGEGATPMFPAPGLGPGILIKDEAQNPTGSFKARGMAVAIPRNTELGAKEFCLPSAGNAGGAAAAYAALHGVKADVAIPATTPRALIEEVEAHGGTVTLVEGSIADASRLQTERAQANAWFTLATLHEPYRVEGKKMMAYEIFWDLGRLPEVILYPTGGGTGLVGMAKAFDEMEALGWIGTERPRMVSIQVDGCAPIVRAFHAGAERAEPWTDPAETSAYGLRVPAAIGDRLMLRALRSTSGTAVAVSEEEVRAGTARLATDAGVWGSPEGGACVAALHRLVDSGWIAEGETVVVFNTGSALKYR
ncbi:MAG: threonine synthase [Acidimicrobiia bacterium]